MIIIMLIIAFALGVAIGVCFTHEFYVNKYKRFIAETRKLWDWRVVDWIEEKWNAR